MMLTIVSLPYRITKSCSFGRYRFWYYCWQYDWLQLVWDSTFPVCLHWLLPGPFLPSYSVFALKPGPHQQQCRSKVRFCRKDEISTQNSFDIVAVFGNKVEFRCFDIVAKNGNNVEATFDFVEATFDIVEFDNFASTLLLVWTGL